MKLKKGKVIGGIVVPDAFIFKVITSKDSDFENVWAKAMQDKPPDMSTAEYIRFIVRSFVESNTYGIEKTQLDLQRAKNDLTKAQGRVHNLETQLTLMEEEQEQKVLIAETVDSVMNTIEQHVWASMKLPLSVPVWEQFKLVEPKALAVYARRAGMGSFEFNQIILKVLREKE